MPLRDDLIERVFACSPFAVEADAAQPRAALMRSKV
jgi:hypothetical protein